MIQSHMAVSECDAQRHETSVVATTHVFVLHEHDLAIGQADGAITSWHIHELFYARARLRVLLARLSDASVNGMCARRPVVARGAAHAARHPTGVSGLRKAAVSRTRRKVLARPTHPSARGPANKKVLAHHRVHVTVPPCPLQACAKHITFDGFSNNVFTALALLSLLNWTRVGHTESPRSESMPHTSTIRDL